MIGLILGSAGALAGVVVVDMLDVGQGDAILIQGGGKFVLIDAGDRGTNTVTQLKQLGVTRLDLVVATHPHADHIGEMADVLRTFSIGLYLDSGLTHTTSVYAEVNAVLTEKKIPRKVAVTGTSISLGSEAKISVLFPGPSPLTGTRSDLNSNSVCVLLTHEDNTFLFTGDAEEPTEYALLQAGLQDVDLLKVAHHGSPYSTTAKFLAVADPEWGLISVGADNRYHHPSPDTIRRLQSVGAAVYRTDTSGNLRVISDGEQIEILEGSLAELIRIPILQR